MCPMVNQIHKIVQALSLSLYIGILRLFTHNYILRIIIYN